MERNYELDEEALVKIIQETGRKIDIIYLMQKYTKAPSDIARNELHTISKQSFNRITEFVDKCLEIAVENNLTHLLCVSPSYFIKTKSFEEYTEYKDSEEYKTYIEYVAPVPSRISDLHLSIINKQLLNTKNINNVNHYDILIKSLNAAVKYLKSIEKKFNLNVATMNYFTQELLQDVCCVVDAVFNAERFINFNINSRKLTNEMSELYNSFYKAKGNVEEQESIREKITILENEFTAISIAEGNKIIGNREIRELYNITPSELEFNFKELKRMIKLKFSTNNKHTENIEQLKYVAWIMQLKTNKKEDVLPFQDKFILDNMIVPWSQELRELLGEDFDNTNFNIEEAINYIGRLRTKGDYSNTPQGRKYKLTALKKVFCLMDKQYTKADVLVLNKEILNADYSVRTGLIIQAMREMGTEKNPVIKSNRGLTITKYGISCSPKAIVLFNYLLGQFVENGTNTTKILLNEEFYRGLNLSNGRGNNLKDIKQQIGAIAGQYIYIDDEKNKDKATKQIKGNLKQASVSKLKTKGASLIDIKYTEIEGQDAIIFTIPLMKMFCSHTQHDRLVDAKAIEHWSQKPRILLITRELGKLSRNKREHTLSIETLLRNIGEWERYKNYSDKKKYFQRLNKDINKAIDYMKTDKSFKYAGCTNGTFKEARIIYE